VHMLRLVLRSHQLLLTVPLPLTVPGCLQRQMIVLQAETHAEGLISLEVKSTATQATTWWV
jgi:hypothetical protein